ncbi:hypothetical protein WME76_45710 (plasmid) [Sorangium sp. So ce119]|uniref:hypothetical protein n=1 Tax=Sorangium sp. So ce119 TaxID=3133279 RepID=UPI003F62E49B
MTIVSYYQAFILVAPAGSLDVSALAQGVSRIESKMDVVAAGIATLQESSREDTRLTRDAMAKGFNEVLTCRAQRELRDVLTAALGYRPLMPCTRRPSGDRLTPANSGFLQPMKTEEACKQQQLTLAIRVPFRLGKFQRTDIDPAALAELQSLGSIVKSLDVGMQAINVEGVSDRAPVSPALCAQMKPLLVGSLVGASDPGSWSCVPAWTQAHTKELNEGLGKLRANTVCAVLGVNCKVTGTQETSKEVRLSFVSQPLELSQGCLD